MINYLCTQGIGNLEKTSKMVNTTSIIIFVISGIVSTAIFVAIVLAIIKTVKGIKNGTLKLENLDNKEETPSSSNFTTCEYCGATNKHDSTSCEKCGANLKHK